MGLRVGLKLGFEMLSSHLSGGAAPMGERRARLGTTKIRHLSVGSANFVGHEGRREHLRPRAAAPATRDNEGGVVCRRNVAVTLARYSHASRGLVWRVNPRCWASLGEQRSAVPTAGWKYLASRYTPPRDRCCHPAHRTQDPKDTRNPPGFLRASLAMRRCE